MPRSWHGLRIDQSFSTERRAISKAAILEFAGEFDPQPYHLDSAAAQASIFGGLCASGWQVSATVMQLVNNAFHSREIPVIETLEVPLMRWKAPVFADDSVYAEVTVKAIDSQPVPEQATKIQVVIGGYNQHDNAILTLQITLLIAKAEGSPQ